MKKRLLLIALATTMTLSMLVGCGKEDSKDEATTPTTNVEQDGNSNVDDTSKEDTTSKDDSSKEEVKGYDEVFYAEPNWEEEYADESDYFKENELPELKLEYQAMKFVFEDMTQNFKHKKEVSALEPIVIGFSLEPRKNTFVCDVANAMPENAADSYGEPVYFHREKYTEFVGFDMDETKAWRYNEEEQTIQAAVSAYMVDGQYPLIVNVTLKINEDGSFTYKEIYVDSNHYYQVK